MATERRRWENIKELGFGGQGRVFLVRRPEAAAERVKAAKRIEGVLMSAGVGLDTDRVSGLVADIFLCGKQDDPNAIAALKEFHVEGRDSEQAIKRLEAEIKALQTIQHPAILKLLDASVEEHFLVTEYFPGGSLSKRADIFKGDPLRAIKAFKVLVEGVKQIHDQGAIHRDIKPENIFVSESGSLVLGDFGIVIFKNDDRLTATFERAGTRYWMAPWIDRKNRISLDKIDATLDIYPLGKLLWSMISGEDMLPRENFEDHEYNLEALFLDTPREMKRINELLKKCVVDKREKCLPNVDDLLSEIERIEIPLAGKREGNIRKWPCRLCRMGEYESQHTSETPNHVSVPIIVQVHQRGYGVDNQKQIHVYACNHCGNVELFMNQ
jgi:serine/threonine protein kinase